LIFSAQLHVEGLQILQKVENKEETVKGYGCCISQNAQDNNILC